MTAQTYSGRTAIFSPCRTWRYALTREWDEARDALNVIGLNPSTADESADDPTIRRCVGYARRWGFGGLVMTNIFAFRSTDPRALKDAAGAGVDPVGPDNDVHLAEQARLASAVLCAWGAHGALNGRSSGVVHRVLHGVRLHVLGFTGGGQPLHPLYLRRDLEPSPWIVV